MPTGLLGRCESVGCSAEPHALSRDEKFNNTRQNRLKEYQGAYFRVFVTGIKE